MKGRGPMSPIFTASLAQFVIPAGFRVAFHLPGMTILRFLELSDSASDPGRAGGLPKGNYASVYHGLHRQVTGA